MSTPHRNNLKERAAQGLVTHDNTGGYFVVECQGCNAVYPSFQCVGGGQIADTGDYDDARCHHCGQEAPEECDNVGLAWNVQQERINALQQRLNAADQGKDDLEFQLKDREASRRDWFDEAQRLKKENEELRSEVKRLDLMVSQADHDYEMKRNDLERQLAERDALLERCRLAAVNGEDFDLPASLLDEIKALSASAEPINDLCAEGAHEFVPLRSDCVKCGALYSAEPSEPVERDERAEFEQAFVVQEGVYFSADRNEYRSINGRPVERTDATDLNLRLQGWQARAALERKPCH